MPNQIALPVPLSLIEVQRKSSLGGSIELCVEAAGLEPKQVQTELKFDKGQWSRWISGDEGIKWARLTMVMDLCGNDAPILWMNHARGWDLNSMRKLETDLERQNRLLREENLALRRVLQVGGES